MSEVVNEIKAEAPWSVDHKSGEAMSVGQKAEAAATGAGASPAIEQPKGAAAAAPAGVTEKAGTAAEQVAPKAATESAAPEAEATVAAAKATEVEPETIVASGVKPTEVEPVAGSTERAAGAAPVAADADAPVATTMYTTETPAVVESADHHLVGESLPITHTRIPDYDEGVKPAPAILNNDLASLLRQGNVSQDTTYLAPRGTFEDQVAQTEAPEEFPTRSTYGSSIPEGYQTSTAPLSYLSGTHISHTAHATAQDTEPVSAHAGSTLPATNLRESNIVSEPTPALETEPTAEQPWSVRGADAGEYTAAATTGEEATPAVPSKTEGTDAVESAAGEAKDAKSGGPLSGVTGAVGGAASGATGAVGGAASGAKNAAGGAASGVTGGAKNVTSGVTGGAKNAANTGKDTLGKAAGQPKKAGFLTKFKRALHIGKEANAAQ